MYTTEFPRILTSAVTAKLVGLSSVLDNSTSVDITRGFWVLSKSISSTLYNLVSACGLLNGLAHGTHDFILDTVVSFTSSATNYQALIIQKLGCKDWVPDINLLYGQ